MLLEKMTQQVPFIPQRCDWVDLCDPLSVAYHDQEWGVPKQDDPALFAWLLLETAQAGLSWKTILHKRAGYQACFADFKPEVIATFDQAKIEALCEDERIIRNKRKISTAVSNARAFLAFQAEQGSFSAFLWSFVKGSPVVNGFASGADRPTTTPLAEQVTRALKTHGFKGIGPTTIYAYLQAVGIVNDHTVDCFCFPS